MKKKIMGICVIMLLISTAIPIINAGNELKNMTNDNKLNDTWYKTYGGDGVDSLKSIDFTDDGGYILSGETQIGESLDAWLMKIDGNGNVLWEITYGDPDGWDGLYPVITTSDGGYLGGGWYYNSSQDKFDALLIKANDDGTISWIFTIGDEGDDEFFGLHEVDDGYLAVGYCSLYSPQENQGFIAKISFDGDLLWHKNLERDGYIGELDSIIDANDGNGYILSGGFYNSLTPPQGRLLKIDYEGNIIWDKSYGKSFTWEWCVTVKNTFDNNYILAGGAKGGLLSLIWGPDIWLMKVDNSGSLIWEKFQGLPILKDYSMCVEPISDGGYVYTGHILGLGGLGLGPFGLWSKAILVKKDADGETLWSKLLPSSGHGMTVKETDDGFILCGFQGGDKGLSSEYGWVIKTDENGNFDK